MGIPPNATFPVACCAKIIIVTLGLLSNDWVHAESPSSIAQPAVETGTASDDFISKLIPSGRITTREPQRADPITSVSNSSAARTASVTTASAMTTGELLPSDSMEILAGPGEVIGLPSDCAVGPCVPNCYGGWVSAELLMWWVDPLTTPALVTTSPTGTPQAQAGVLGQPGTSVLLGGDLLDGLQTGGRFSIGAWLDPCQSCSVELDYLFLGQESDDFQAAGQGDPILARPFFNVETGAEASALVSFPNFVDGSIAVTAQTEFQAWDVLFRKRFVPEPCISMDLLLGYRGASLDERLRISESTVAQNAAVGVPVGTAVDAVDRFDVDNEFQGATLGAAAQWSNCQYTFELLMKLSLGSSQSRVTIDGSTVSTPAGGGSTTTAGGLLALPTNIGVYEDSDFAFVPEIGVKCHWDISPCWRATLGYTLIHWSGVMRPGNAIDPNLNLSQLPLGVLNGAPLPAFAFNKSDFLGSGTKPRIAVRVLACGACDRYAGPRRAKSRAAGARGLGLLTMRSLRSDMCRITTISI